jgi:hypothetical protein
MAVAWCAVRGRAAAPRTILRCGSSNTTASPWRAEPQWVPQLRRLSTYSRPLRSPGKPAEPARARKEISAAEASSALGTEYSYPSIQSILVGPAPRRFSEYDHETIGLLAGQGIHGAIKERLLREIMRVDQCPYVEAYSVLGEMNECNEQGMWVRKMPYNLGIGATAATGLVAVPAVFHRGAHPRRSH